MVPADDEHMDSTEATSETNKKEREPARLTPMPDWLMKWWIPILLALILLAAGWFLASIWRMPPRPVLWWTINPYWPPSWPFNYHWPSKDAMALCATIAGGGFAFSAWQQKSHDNAVKEKEQARAQRELEADRQERERIRLEQIERDEYWKRREQIYQLLGSKNPGLRLGAVALLAELADTAAHSALLNDTEKQQLQRHIIDTLCLQFRHEGLCLNSEGTEREHESIQKQIFCAILKRINQRQSNRQYADWTREPIAITNCRILPPIAVTNLTTTATLDFSNSEFQQSVSIQNSTIDSLIWNSATLRNNITIGSEDKKCRIGTNTVPHCKGEVSASYTTFQSNSNGFTIYTPSASCGKYSFEHCTFISTGCRCNIDCHCRTHTTAGNCRCMTQDMTKCTCTGLCINNKVTVHTAEDIGNPPTRTRDLAITNCQLSTLEIILSNNSSEIYIEENIITTQLYITFFWLFKEIKAHSEDNPEEPTLYIQWNTFFPQAHSQPIDIYDNDGLSHPHIIFFSGNKMINPADYDDKRPLLFSFNEDEPQPYTFSEKVYPTTLEPLVGSWQTGGYVEDDYDDTEE